MRFWSVFWLNFAGCAAIWLVTAGPGCQMPEPNSPAAKTADAAGAATAAAVTTAAAPVLGPAAPVAGWLAGKGTQLGLSWLLGMLMGGYAADKVHRRKKKKAGKAPADPPDLPVVPGLNPIEDLKRLAAQTNTQTG